MFKKYVVGNAETDKEIDLLAKKYSTPQSREQIRELLTTVIKLHLDKACDRELYLTNVALKELRHIFRIFARYRGFMKVVVFGSHCTPQKSRIYKMAEEFSRKITKKGFMVITGGGGGIMEASNKGAGSKGFAVKIKLPNEFEPNKYVSKGEKLITVKYFFTRKLAFIKESDATVLFPGGFGTHDEGFEILTLLMTGKSLPRPIIMVEPKGDKYWDTWLRFVKHGIVKHGYLRKDDLAIFKIVHSADEAVKAIEKFYNVYHSTRHGKDYTVIRLNKKVPESKLKRLSKKYKDMLTCGAIQPGGPLPVEVRDKDLLHLPRICFMFDHKSYSRLVELIWELNSL